MDIDLSRFVLVVGGLGQGEVEAMALYKFLSADFLLIDDHRARLIAETNDIRCIGALGILLLAKQKKHINEIFSYIQIIKESPIHYSDELLAKVLQLAGE